MVSGTDFTFVFYFRIVLELLISYDGCTTKLGYLVFWVLTGADYATDSISMLLNDTFEFYLIGLLGDFCCLNEIPLSTYSLTKAISLKSYERSEALTSDLAVSS